MSFVFSFLYAPFTTSAPRVHTKKGKKAFSNCPFFFFLLRLMFEDLKLPSKQLTVKNEEEKKASF